MKQRLTILALLALTFASACINTGPDTVFRQGPWRLEIYRTYAKGTESEGQFGMLFKDGQLVIPKAKGETIETDLGRVKYYKDPTEPHQMFERLGWNFEDTTRSK